MYTKYPRTTKVLVRKLYAALTTNYSLYYCTAVLNPKQAPCGTNWFLNVLLRVLCTYGLSPKTTSKCLVEPVESGSCNYLYAIWEIIGAQQTDGNLPWSSNARSTLLSVSVLLCGKKWKTGKTRTTAQQCMCTRERTYTAAATATAVYSYGTFAGSYPQVVYTDSSTGLLLCT